MASILLEERTLRLRYGKRKRRKRAAGARILETAGRRVKRDGIPGPGIAALMAEAGLRQTAPHRRRAAVRET